ncbi:MAG: lysophospholipid acyltransferase family protein [Candidatus Omnitrophota bacterium]
MMYYVYKTIIFIARRLPLKGCYMIAGIAARFFYIFASRDKIELKENLKVVLGAETDKKILNKYVLEIFRNFAKYLVDFFRFQKITKEYIDKNVHLKGQNFLDECIAGGKGAVIVALHFGNWELGGAVMGTLGYPISAIVLEHKDKRVDDFFNRQRLSNHMTPIPIGSRIRECFGSIKNNEFVGVVGDKDYTNNGIPVTFFGKKAIIPRGPATLSLRTGAPIVFCCLIRKKDNTYDMCLEKPIYYEPTGDDKKDEEALMGMYLRIAEKYIKENPEQWYVFRRLWLPEQTIQ